MRCYLLVVWTQLVNFSKNAVFLERNFIVGIQLSLCENQVWVLLGIKVFSLELLPHELISLQKLISSRAVTNLVNPVVLCVLYSKTWCYDARACFQQKIKHFCQFDFKLFLEFAIVWSEFIRQDVQQLDEPRYSIWVFSVHKVFDELACCLVQLVVWFSLLLNSRFNRLLCVLDHLKTWLNRVQQVCIDELADQWLECRFFFLILFEINRLFLPSNVVLFAYNPFVHRVDHFTGFYLKWYDDLNDFLTTLVDIYPNFW